MTPQATLMDGRALAAQVRDELRVKVASLKERGVGVTLATILVGDDPASKTYVGNKHKAAGEVGIRSENHVLGADATESSVRELIRGLNARPDINGMILQLPLPGHLEPQPLIEEISVEKDVDGLTSGNMRRLFYGGASLIPCTPKGVMRLLHHYKVPIRGVRAVIINRSNLVGKPLYHLLLQEDATVTNCHSKSIDLPGITREADILISAVGRRPQFTLTAEMVKEGAAVVDVASLRLEGKWVGDADFPRVAEKASFITPVPGGVGPMTVAMLLENTVLAAARQHKMADLVA